MFLFLFLLSYTATEMCKAQVISSQIIPYDPRYMIRRPPPVRRSAMDALERMRLPVSRYFPQVDTQIASAPYLPPLAPYSTYQLTPDDINALPPQWTEELIQQLPERNDDYDTYEDYESANDFAPVYRIGYPDELYPQDQDSYNDLMVNYVLGEAPVNDPRQAEIFEIQRRGQPESIPIADVLEANKNSTANGTAVVATVSSTNVPSDSSSARPQVQMTAVPASPEKKEIKSMLIPEPISDLEESWPKVEDRGQKEVPLFRPRQNSQQTKWSALEEQLSRAKNSNFKSPIPIIKRMIQRGSLVPESDPLMEQLNSLKKHHKP